MAGREGGRSVSHGSGYGTARRGRNPLAEIVSRVKSLLAQYGLHDQIEKIDNIDTWNAEAWSEDQAAVISKYANAALSAEERERYSETLDTIAARRMGMSLDEYNGNFSTDEATADVQSQHDADLAATNDFDSFSTSPQWSSPALQSGFGTGFAPSFADTELGPVDPNDSYGFSLGPSAKLGTEGSLSRSQLAQALGGTLTDATSGDDTAFDRSYESQSLDPFGPEMYGGPPSFAAPATPYGAADYARDKAEANAMAAHGVSLQNNNDRFGEALAASGILGNVGSMIGGETQSLADQTAGQYAGADWAGNTGLGIAGSMPGAYTDSERMGQHTNLANQPMHGIAANNISLNAPNLGPTVDAGFVNGAFNGAKGAKQASSIADLARALANTPTDVTNTAAKADLAPNPASMADSSEAIASAMGAYGAPETYGSNTAFDAAGQMMSPTANDSLFGAEQAQTPSLANALMGSAETEADMGLPERNPMTAQPGLRDYVADFKGSVKAVGPKARAALQAVQQNPTIDNIAAMTDVYGQYGNVNGKPSKAARQNRRDQLDKFSSQNSELARALAGTLQGSVGSDSLFGGAPPTGPAMGPMGGYGGQPSGPMGMGGGNGPGGFGGYGGGGQPSGPMGIGGPSGPAGGPMGGGYGGGGQPSGPAGPTGPTGPSGGTGGYGGGQPSGPAGPTGPTGPAAGPTGGGYGGGQPSGPAAAGQAAHDAAAAAGASPGQAARAGAEAAARAGADNSGYGGMGFGGFGI